MNTNYQSTPRRNLRPGTTVAGLLAAVTLGVMLGTSSYADMYHPVTNAPGGVPAQSTASITNVTSTNVTICGYGMQGWYDVELSTNLITWVTAGHKYATDFSWCVTVTNVFGTASANARLNQNNAYVGQGACSGCHGDKYTKWVGTAHADAFDVITNEVAQQSCLPCHSVGNGQPTGFTSSIATPQLKNVGCEACHGPAGWHKYSDHDLIRPAVSIDPKICGGCHVETYEEYEPTLHAEQNLDIKYGNALATNYVSDTFVTSSNTLYGYYRVYYSSTNTWTTNATSGIIHSSYGPANNPIYDQGQDRQVGCGICHSAAARMAQLNDYEARLKGYTNALVLPSAQDAAAWTATCATCHDPHSTGNPAQLRYPTRSTNYFTMATTADKRTVISTNFMGVKTTNTYFMSAAFANMYNPKIQVCGQCHNGRGARWDGLSYGFITNGSTRTFGLTTNSSQSRPPHHNPQYNMLIGILQPDYLTTDGSGVATNYSARHGLGVSSSGVYNTNQCATCHAPIYKSGGADITGHSFKLDTNNCTLCHSSGAPDYEGYGEETRKSITNVVTLLTYWATNCSPAILRTNYGALAWEYTSPGVLGNPSLSTTVAGPPSAYSKSYPASPTNANLQAIIPTNILQARFNLYMLQYDGSGGVHNPSMRGLLLSDSTTKVTSTIGVATNNAYFTASAIVGYAPLSVTFTSLGVGITNYSWDFGDGKTSSSANPANTFTNRGTYTVTLTATDNTGAVSACSLSVRACNKPVVSFNAAPKTGTATLTVWFTNTSSSVEDVVDWRWTPKSNTNITNNNSNWSYDYTSAGTNNVALRAYTPVGNVSVTSNSFIKVTSP